MLTETCRLAFARNELDASDHIFIEVIVEQSGIERQGVQDPVLSIV